MVENERLPQQSTLIAFLTPAKQKNRDFSCIFWDFLAKTAIFEVTDLRGFFCAGRELRRPDFDQFHQTFLFFLT